MTQKSLCHLNRLNLIQPITKSSWTYLIDLNSTDNLRDLTIAPNEGPQAQSTWTAKAHLVSPRSMPQKIRGSKWALKQGLIGDQRSAGMFHPPSGKVGCYGLPTFKSNT